MAGIKWSLKEIELLKNIYPESEKEHLLINFPLRNYNSIKLKAALLGIKKDPEFYENTEIKKLLDESLNSYYWLGFLAADGHFNKKSKRINLTLGKKDKDHLKKFVKYFKLNSFNKQKRKGNIVAYRSSVRTVLYFDEIINKYDLSNTKTYNPFKLEVLEKMTDSQFLSFLIGFTDGDGCIHYQHGRKDCSIRFRVHGSWENILNYFSRRVYSLVVVKKYNSNIKTEIKSIIQNKKYAVLIWTNSQIVKFLKLKTIEYGLPILNRKWSKIDLNYVSKYEKTFLNRKKVNKLHFEKNKKAKEISKILNISIDSIYLYIREIKKNGLPIG